MRDCEDTDIFKLQSLTLDDKIILTKKRLIEFYSYMDGKVYVSFSGGKDSTVLLHITRSVFPDVVAVFCDTGLEYPEIKDFVRATGNVITIRPTMSFKEVLVKYGWPLVSKDVSKKIYEYRTTKSETYKEKKLSGVGSIPEKWKYLLRSDIKISHLCCDVMKKRPFKKFEKQTGLSPIIGTLVDESRLRRMQWIKEGCNSFDSKRPSSRPLSFWTEGDIREYITRYALPLCSVYYRGAVRTGCLFCLYGYHMDMVRLNKQGIPCRLTLLKTLHPKIHEYCTKEEGLGMSKVLEWYPDTLSTTVIDL